MNASIHNKKSIFYTGLEGYRKLFKQFKMEARGNTQYEFPCIIGSSNGEHTKKVELGSNFDFEHIYPIP